MVLLAVSTLDALGAAPGGPSPVSGIGLSLAIGGTSLLVLFVVVGYVVWQRRQLDDRLEAFIESSGFRIVRDDTEFERIADKLALLCGVGAKILRAAVRKVDTLEVLLVAYRFPQYRVDADGSWDEALQESERCVTLVVSGFPMALPVFRLMPNNWASEPCAETTPTDSETWSPSVVSTT